MTAAPLWSMTGLPRLARGAVAVTMSVVLLPVVPQVTDPGSLATISLSMGMEFLIGLLIGLTAAVFLHGAGLAGEIIISQMGLNLGPSAASMSDVLVPGVGQLKTAMVTLIYLGIDGHLILLRGVADSLQAFPPGMAFIPDAGPPLAIHLMTTMYKAAIQAAAPAMVALVLIDVAVGIMSRAVPQLNAIMVLFPVTILLGLVMVAAAMPMTAQAMYGWMADLGHHVGVVLEALSKAKGGN